MTTLITLVLAPLDPRGTLARATFGVAVCVCLAGFIGVMLVLEPWLSEGLEQNVRGPATPESVRVHVERGLVLLAVWAASMWVFGVLVVKRGRALGLPARTSLWRASVPPANLIFHYRLWTEPDPPTT